MDSLRRIARAARDLRLRRARVMDPRGRVVLVLGGTRGLGRELARRFASLGANVAIIGRDPEHAALALDELRERGTLAYAESADVRDGDALTAAIRRVTDRLGPIDILVNDAGIIAVGPLDALTEDDYREAMDTHFWGPLRATMAVLPSMRARRSGRIVNVSSIGGRIGVPHLVPYSASKFALAGWSEALRAELVRENVYVTTVIPGLMRTGSTEYAQFKGRNRAEYTWFALADATPFLSVDVDDAARDVVEATLRGDAVVTISVPAKIAAALHGIAPSLVAEASGIAARFLPRMGGIGSSRRSGAESHTTLAPSALTTLTNERVQTHQDGRA